MSESFPRPQRRNLRLVALSLVSLGTAAAGIALAMRESEAETPESQTNSSPALLDAGAVAASQPKPLVLSESRNTSYEPATGGNRIRFGAAISSDPTGRGPYDHTCGPECDGRHELAVSSRSPRRDYAVQQAAGAESAAANDPYARQSPTPAPVRGVPTMAPPRNPLPPPTMNMPEPPAASQNDIAPSGGFGAGSAGGEDRYGAAATTASRSPPMGVSLPASPLPSAPLETSAAPATAPSTAASPYAASSSSLPPAAAPPPFAAAPRELPPAAAARPEPVATVAPTPAPLPPPTAAAMPRQEIFPRSAAVPPSQPIVEQHAPGVSGTGRPGEKALEGSQAPTLVIEKFAPAEIQVGKPAQFEIVVRNEGNTTAANVEIHDVVPQGTQLLSSNPKAAPGRPGELLWLLGPMKPGDEARVQMELMPTTEGEIGSIATVHFAAAASARTICTKPELVVEVQGPRSVMLGDEVPLKIRVFNPGTGVATGIYLKEIVPSNMEHAAGGELEYEVGELQPNETRELELLLRAVAAGRAMNVIHGKGDGRLASETKTEFDVVAPALAVAIDGPKRRYLDRQATYTVSLSNPGTAAAREVALATFLPKGMQFIDADNQGEYDEATHSVRWLLEELPPQQRGSVTLTALPVEPGQQLLRVEGTADRGVTASKEEAILVEGAASIAFQVVDTADPIEVGGETEYEIVVANQGSKEATNVRLSVTLADGMKALNAEGPAKHALGPRQVQFQALPSLPPKSETTFRVRAQCLTPGDHRCHVELLSDDMKTPVTKEEGTRVYADE